MRQGARLSEEQPWRTKGHLTRKKRKWDENWIKSGERRRRWRKRGWQSSIERGEGRSSQPNEQPASGSDEMKSKGVGE